MSIPTKQTAPPRKWYTMEITYQNREEIRMLRLVNMSPDFVRQVREQLFVIGFYRSIDRDTGEIISPHWIRGVMLYRQATFFGEADVESMASKSWQQVHDTDLDKDLETEKRT